jgi:hypothetical protein
MVPARTVAFTAEDEGKRVVTTGGEVVGEIARTEDGTAFVRPSRELVSCYGSRITSCLDPDELLPLDASAVTLDGEERVRIKPEERPEPGTVHPTE